MGFDRVDPGVVKRGGRGAGERLTMMEIGSLFRAALAGKGLERGSGVRGFGGSGVGWGRGWGLGCGTWPETGRVGSEAMAFSLLA